MDRDAPIPWTWALCGLLVAAWVAGGLWQWHLGYESLADALLWGRDARFRAAVGAQLRLDVLAGEDWRLLTGVFSHADPVHLGLNVVAIGTLGRVLEPWIGGARVWGVFVAGGLGGAALTHGVGILFSDGASGGAFALLGAAAVLAWGRRAMLDEEDRRVLGPWLWGFIAVNLILSFALPFINAAGHVGGLIVGAAWAGWAHAKAR